MKRKFAIGVIFVVPLIVGVIIGHEVRRAKQATPQQMAASLMQRVPQGGFVSAW